MINDDLEKKGVLRKIFLDFFEWNRRLFSNKDKTQKVDNPLCSQCRWTRHFVLTPERWNLEWKQIHPPLLLCPSCNCPALSAEKGRENGWKKVKASLGWMVQKSRATAICPHMKRGCKTAVRLKSKDKGRYRSEYYKLKKLEDPPEAPLFHYINKEN